MFSLKIILFILSICFVSSNEIYTRTQLRGLYHHNMNKLLNEEIQRIVERVVASAKQNQTSYTEVYYINTILDKFSNKIIINRIKNILIDINITISGPKCCSNYEGNCQTGEETLCKHFDFNW